MAFKNLKSKAIDSFINDCNETESEYVLIVLTNGENLIGRLNNHSRSRPKNLVCLRHFKKAICYEFYIPYKKIAGLGLWNVEQEIEMTEPGGNADLEETAFLDFQILHSLLEKSKMYEFRYEVSFLKLSIDIRTPKPLGIKFDDVFKPLYCNWDYIARISGGVKPPSLTIGLSIISLGFEYENSVYNQLESLFRKTKETPLSKLSPIRKTIVQGFITFLMNDGLYQTQELDGEAWLNAIISNKRIHDIKDLKNTAWCLAVIQRKYSIIPVDLWDKINVPVSMFGEVFEIQYETEMGISSELLKVHAIAFVP